MATPETEWFWVEQARTTGRRELEQRVAATQGAARVRRRAPGQGELLSASGVDGPANGQAGAERDSADGAAGEVVSPVIEVPVTVSFQLSPEQYARYEAMLERARKGGMRGSREELFLAAWEMITRGDTPGTASAEHAPEVITRGNTTRLATPPRVSASSTPRYQIVIRQCETCGRAEIETGRGAMPDRAQDPGDRALRCARASRRARRTARPSRRPCGARFWPVTVTAAAPRAAGARVSWTCITLCRALTEAPTTPRTWSPCVPPVIE